MADRVTKVTLLAVTSNYVSGMQAAMKATQDTASAADSAKAKVEAQQKVLDATGKAAVAFGAAAALGVAAAVKAYADWSAKMAQVQALSHANTADMQALSSETFNFAAKYGISASQAADAELELVKGGVSVKDMINGGLSGALTLAADGQMNVGDATSIAVSAMTQFHLKGQDVSHIADLLAAGADKALGSVSDLGEGLKYVGPVASSMGVSIEQTVGTLSLLAQNGILAEQAGTGLRGMMMSLTAPSQQASDVMKTYGINVYDAQGKFVGFDGVAQQLKTHLGGLDQATRNQALGQIFGNQQITTATILMQGGAAAVDKWTKAVNDQGFASQQASAKMDSLTGNFTKMKATLENDLVQTGQGSSGPLNAAVKGVTDLATAYGHLPQPMKDAALYAAAAAAGIGLIGGASVLALPKIVAFDTALETMGAKPRLITGALSSVTSFLTGPWGAAIGISAGVIGGAFLISQEQAKKRVDDLAASLDQQTGAITDNTRATVAKALEDSGAFDGARRLGLALDTVTDAAMGNTEAMQEVNAAVDAYKKANEAGGTAAGRAVPMTDITKLTNAIGDESGALGKAKKNAQDLSEATDGLTSSSSAAASGASDAATSVDQVQQAADDASQSVDDLAKALEGLDNGTIDASESQVAFNQAVSDAATNVTNHTKAAKGDKSAAEDLANAVNKTHTAFNLSSSAGRDNQKALDGIASSALSMLGAQYKASGSTTQLASETASARSQFIAAAKQMGLSEAAAEGLANKYGLIPGDVSTLVGLYGVPAAVAGAGAVRQAVENIPTIKTVQIKVNGASALMAIGGAGGPRIANAQGGVWDYYANGGFSENHVAQIAPAGSMRLWAEPETGGEAYIPLAPSKRSRSLAIWEETGRRLQAFAGGGITGPTVTVSAPSLDGLAIGERLEIDASGLVQLVDGRIYTHAKADGRTIRNGRRRY